MKPVGAAVTHVSVKRNRVKSAPVIRRGALPFTLTQHQPNVHAIVFDDVRVGWEQWVLLRGDAHHDNIQTRWDLEKRDLDEAVAKSAPVIDVGDIFCAMQGKYDPRSSMDDLREEHKTAKYLDALVKTAADFYSPYSRNFTVIAKGNHDTSILARHGVDLVGNLVSRLNVDHDGHCFAGGYGGWVSFQFLVQKTAHRQRLLKYYHGSGGGGPVTRGVIQSNRMAVNYPGADFVVSGHTHDEWIIPIKREYLSNNFQVAHSIAWHIRTPTYKDEHATGEGGYAVERAHNPKPLGCVWLRFYYVHQSDIAVDVIPRAQ